MHCEKLLNILLVVSKIASVDTGHIQPVGDLVIVASVFAGSAGFAFAAFFLSSSSNKMLSRRDSTPATACWKKLPTPHFGFWVCEFCAMVSDVLDRECDSMTRQQLPCV